MRCEIGPDDPVRPNTARKVISGPIMTRPVRSIVHPTALVGKHVMVLYRGLRAALTRVENFAFFPSVTLIRVGNSLSPSTCFIDISSPS